MPATSSALCEPAWSWSICRLPAWTITCRSAASPAPATGRGSRASRRWSSIPRPARPTPMRGERMSEPRCVWDLKAELGEGPVWMEDGAAVWFVDIKGLRIHRYSTGTGETRSWDAPAPPSFLAPRAGGGFLCGLQTGLHAFDPETGAFTLVSQVEPDRPGNRLNDGCVDGEGALWFGSMDDAE